MPNRFLVGLLFAALSLVGCPQGNPAGSTAPPAEEQGLPSDIPKIQGGGVTVVPESVKGKWGAVRLVVEDKSTGATTEYAVPLRSRFAVPNTSLTLEVGDFLPDFTIQDSVFTSVSDRPENPAVKVTVVEAGNPIFDAWLFSMYPSVHPFTHPRYGLSLKEGVPAT
ncbi:MAG: DUF2155 domain-containing protein [Nitrospirota bacterium]